MSEAAWSPPPLSSEFQEAILEHHGVKEETWPSGEKKMVFSPFLAHFFAKLVFIANFFRNSEKDIQRKYFPVSWRQRQKPPQDSDSSSDSSSSI